MKNLNSITEKFKNASALVIGDIIVDRYIYGKSNKLSPEFPVPLIVTNEDKIDLGGSMNVALNLSTIGVNTTICGVVGNDKYGNEVIDRANKRNIDCKYVFKKKDIKTTVKTRIISNGSHLARIDRDIEKIPINEKDISVIKKIIPNFDMVIISDYNKGLITSQFMKEIIIHASSNNINVYVDPKQDPKIYKGANFLTPNQKELDELFLKNSNEKDMQVNINKIIKENDFDGIVVTQSEKGYTYYGNNDKIRGSINKVKVNDICGAGDTFISYLSLFHFFTKDIKLSLNYASKLATLSVTHNRVYAPNKKDIEKIIKINNEK